MRKIIYATGAIELSREPYQTAPEESEKDRELRKLQLSLMMVGADLLRRPRHTLTQLTKECDACGAIIGHADFCPKAS